MSGFTQVEQQETLDQRFPTAGATDVIAVSKDGATEWTAVARTPVGDTGWAPATAATPSVKANSALIVTAGTTEAGTASHWAVFKGGAGGAQRTDWAPILDPTTRTATPLVLALGDKIEFAPGDAEVKLD